MDEDTKAKVKMVIIGLVAFGAVVAVLNVMAG